MTSRLFILERVKKELDRQIASTKASNLSTSTTTLAPSLRDHNDEEEEEDDENTDYDNIVETTLLEDFKADPDKCAFSTINEKKCLTNVDVYNLLYNQSDLLKLSKTIDQQINKPDERICTSIDLSAFGAILSRSLCIRSSI